MKLILCCDECEPIKSELEQCAINILTKIDYIRQFGNLSMANDANASPTTTITSTKKKIIDRWSPNQNVAFHRMFKDIPRVQIAHKLHHSAVVLLFSLS